MRRLKTAWSPDTVDSIIHTVQEVSSELRPSVLDELGLDAALEWQLKVFSEKSGIKSTFRTDVDPDIIDPDLGIALFRISQEALTNVARHAGASEVKVELSMDGGGSLVLLIKDNGSGIKENQIGGIRSFGILSMKERAYAFGGEVEISGVEDEGTTLIVRIPFATTMESGIDPSSFDE